jgi:4-hydroxy-tetrahydrodipicolinate reductase
LTGALDIATSPAINIDALQYMGKLGGILVTDDLRRGLANAQVMMDFTRPEGTLAHLQVCRELGVKAVIGTTGFSDAQKAEIAEIAKDIAIVMSPNMSVGVNVTFKLLEMAAKALNTGYDIEVVETHHRHKIDAPSGTALKMGEVMADALGGDVIGDHTVIFAGTGERIEISHKASSREYYAKGSLMAARFLVDKPNGLFDMFDVLGLR